MSTLVYTFGGESAVAEVLARFDDHASSAVSEEQIQEPDGGPNPGVEVVRRPDGILELVTRVGEDRACSRLAALGVGFCSCADPNADPPRHLVADVALQPDRVGGKPVYMLVSKAAVASSAGWASPESVVAAAIAEVLEGGEGAQGAQDLLTDTPSAGAAQAQLSSEPPPSWIEVVDLAPCWWDGVPDGLMAVERGTTAVGNTVEVTLAPTASGDIDIACVFDARRYAPSSVEALLDAVEGLLRRAQCGEGATERNVHQRSVLVGPSVVPVDLTTLLAQIAARRSTATALSDTSHEWDWTELNERVRSLADRLKDQGIEHGVSVGVRSAATAEYVSALLAIWTTGATAVPYSSSANTRDRAIMGSVNALLADGRLQPGGRALADMSPAIAFIAHTSGSTGEPKPVPVARDALATYATAFAHEISLGPDDLMVGVNSPMFDGFYEEVLAPLAVGARVHLADVYHGIPELVDLISAMGGTVLDLPTALWHLFADYLDELEEPMPLKLRTVVIGGEAYQGERASRFLARGAGGVELISTYGPVECTISAAMMRVGRRDLDTARPLLGRPMPGVVMAVVDDQSRSVVRGAVGEICIGGYGVSPGVPVVPVLNPITGRKCPMYRTGDLGRIRPDCTLEFLGRRDDEVKIRGYRVAPAEIRQVIRAIKGVTDVAVLGIRGRDGVELAAIVAGSDSLDTKDVLAGLRRALPEYLVPTKLKMVSSLPVSETGKTDRARIIDLLRNS